jgi:hypothetical protein
MSRAWLVKRLVVTNTPLVAPLLSKAPASPCIAGAPTELSSAYRLAWTVDHAETELVLANDPVDASIAGSSEPFGCLAMGSAVPDGDEKVDDELLKSSW